MITEKCGRTKPEVITLDAACYGLLNSIVLQFVTGLSAPRLNMRRAYSFVFCFVIIIIYMLDSVDDGDGLQGVMESSQGVLIVLGKCCCHDEFYLGLG